MIRQEINKCQEWGHAYHMNLNFECEFNVKPRSASYQIQILRKLLEKSIRIKKEIETVKDHKCHECLRFIKEVIKYFNFVKNNLEVMQVRIDFEILTYNITLTKSRMFLKHRTKFRGKN